jgi:DNA-binding SARP family transcriptional activator
VRRHARSGRCKRRALNALIRAAHVDRAQGDWNGERAGLDFAIESLRACDSRFVVWALAEAVMGAWLAGHERARRLYVDWLRESIVRFDAPAFAHFAALSMGESGEPAGIESPRWLACAHLTSACSAGGWTDARESANLALAAAIDASEPFLQFLAHIACAEFDEDMRHEHLRQALRLSQTIDTPALAMSVRRIISNDESAGVVQPFIGRLRRDRNTDDAALVVNLASGSVRRGRQAIALSERELAVALALAHSQKSIPSVELAELIWPDLDESAGSHAVQTCMHRLRQRLGGSHTIENTPHGYRLRDDILVDVFEIELFMRSLTTEEALDELTGLRLAAIAKQLEGTRPAFMAGWEWFAPIERRIEEWSRTARHRLAQDALQLKAYDEALHLAQALIVRDELDEPAWEIAIRALLENGNRAGAQRELRRYREITLRELNSEPSAELRELVESAELEPKRRLRVVGD